MTKINKNCQWHQGGTGTEVVGNTVQPLCQMHLFILITRCVQYINRDVLQHYRQGNDMSAHTDRGVPISVDLLEYAYESWRNTVAAQWNIFDATLAHPGFANLSYDRRTTTLRNIEASLKASLYELEELRNEARRLNYNELITLIQIDYVIIHDKLDSLEPLLY